MIVDKKQSALIDTCIKEWLDQGHIDQPTAEALKQTYSVGRKKTVFDWKNLSLIAFFFSITCIFLSTVLVISDKWLTTLMDQLIDASDLFKAGCFLVLSGGLYYWAYVRKKHNIGKIYSNEALFMFGAVSLSFALTYLSFGLHLNRGDFPLLILLAAITFAIAGIFLRSMLTWYLALLALTIWFGTETGYRSAWDTHFWGMNYPLRYAFFGSFLLLASQLFQRFGQTKPLVESTFSVGIIGLFFSFWLLSIFGNYGDWDAWALVAQWRFIFWVVVLTLASAVAIYFGLKQDNKTARDVGVVFLLLNIYTRYFEYLWGALPKVLFFIILAASFWFIGKKAENLWSIAEKNLSEKG